MKPILILEPNIANKIAAGEVVERPASIVKELLENSIDAGATAITVEIQNGGIDHIRITDNGCGIPESDTKLAFTRHATSKLRCIADLDSLTSFGFRGEALASIAAVAKVTLRTRTEHTEYGTKLSVEGGSFAEPVVCACPLGTTIEVDELFYNVPARLKFVKNARTEAAMITDYTSRIMLANPNISIKLINSGRTVIHTTGDGSLANTILCVYGASVFASMYELSYDDGYICINGYVGGESSARANRIQQSVFINHRYIKSPVISNAVQRAYLTRIMQHRFPFFVLNILISSREVDVNVHPNKLSVRFCDEERVARAVTDAVNSALRSQPVSVSAADITAQPYCGPQINGDQFGYTAITSDADSPRYERVCESTLNGDVCDLFASRRSNINLNSNAAHRLLNINENEHHDAETLSPQDFTLNDSGNNTYPDFIQSPTVKDCSNKDYRDVDFKNDNNSKFFESKPLMNSKNGADSLEGELPVYKVAISEKTSQQIVLDKAEQLTLDTDICTVIGAAFDTYIIVQEGEAIYYIDQHAAHERILYENLISGKLKFTSQFVSPPLELEFDPIAFDCIVQNEDRFSEFGYSIEFGNSLNVLLHTVPIIIESSHERFFRDAVDLMLEQSDVDEVDLMRSRLIQMSCKRAVKAGAYLDERQLKAIVDAYATGEVPLTCPHGRPVLICVTKKELQKMFKRIV